MLSHGSPVGSGSHWKELNYMNSGRRILLQAGQVDSGVLLTVEAEGNQEVCLRQKLHPQTRILASHRQLRLAFMHEDKVLHLLCRFASHR